MGRNKFVIIAVCIAFVVILGQLAGIRTFVENGGGQDGSFAFRLFSDFYESNELGQDGNKQDDLLLKIREEAAKRRIEPVNATVDRVWKAIPGYNGREVDIERTYQKAKLLPAGAEIEYIYREIKPQVSLDDLGAQPIYRGNPNKPMAALMINVAWGEEYLLPMLDTLDEAKVKATFFWTEAGSRKIRSSPRKFKNGGICWKITPIPIPT